MKDVRGIVHFVVRESFYLIGGGIIFEAFLFTEKRI
jgi:hypothetical protein